LAAKDRGGQDNITTLLLRFIERGVVQGIYSPLQGPTGYRRRGTKFCRADGSWLPRVQADVRSHNSRVKGRSGSSYRRCSRRVGKALGRIRGRIRGRTHSSELTAACWNLVVSIADPRYSQIPQIAFINHLVGTGAAGRHLLSHLTSATVLPDGKACGASAKTLRVLICKAWRRLRV